MTNSQAIQLLQQIRQKYRTRKLLSYALQSLGVGLLVGMVVWKWTNTDWYGWMAGAVTAILTLAAYVWTQPFLRTPLREVALHLDRTRPELERSTLLLFKPTQELTLLENLQLQRVLHALSSLAHHSDNFVQVSFKKAWLVPVFCLAAALLLGLLPIPQAQPAQREFASNATQPITAISEALPQIRQIEIEVIPPIYTRKPAYAASSPDLRVEQEARVRWKITTSRPVDTLKWVLNDQSHFLKADSQSPDTYFKEEQFNQSGFYYLEIAGKKSDYYAIEVIPDAPPDIQVQKPEPYTDLTFGDPLYVTLKANLTDDYGIQSANLVATVAKGSGEAVKFREEKISLNTNFQAHQSIYTIAERLDMIKLGMEWGDELYFYLQAWDNHRGYTRSDTYFVRMEDTTQTTAGFDLTLGVNPMPEYFRSQRQIIIDTEKLLKEKAGLSAEEFNTRSNNIGIDQRILRLRYGKFLGEEAESGTGDVAGKEELGEGHDEFDGHDHSHGAHSRTPQTFGENKEDMLEPYSHRHDSEEGATFLEPAVKTKLKASLAQMWEAELHLRTHQPKAALPFEYKALKLLKEVQQSSRAYVQKTGFDPPPIKPREKRLTGDLSKVKQVKVLTKDEQKTELPAIRQTLSWVASQRQSREYGARDASMLEKAGQEMAQEALRSPGKYLTALQDLRKLVTQVRAKETLCQSCLLTVEKACWQLLPEARSTPVRQQVPRNRLADAYFRKLQ
jgi:hypothetical protein